MQQLALTIVLTSQGIPFLHAGTEFLRTKKGVENSFNSGDSINYIDWSFKNSHKEVFDYVAALIRLRKAHPAFRMATSRQINSYLRFENGAPGTIVYTINGAAVHDKWNKILVALNGSNTEKEIELPPGNWKDAFTNSPVNDSSVTLKKISSYIFYQE